MENLEIYNKLKNVPIDYQKKIGGGRLSGMTDIKPQWRIQKMTEIFGVCGIGWKFEIIDIKYSEKDETTKHPRWENYEGWSEEFVLNYENEVARDRENGIFR